MTVETKLDLLPETMQALHGLIQINIDSRDGFRYAAECLQDVALSNTFERFASERQRQADELAGYLEWNGEESPRTGSFAAAVHRSWISIRELLSSDNVYAVLAEAERGEDYIKQAYEDALRKTAGSALNDVLLHQFAAVKQVHDRVRVLRDARQS
jgi:uncharacterized protein (TIGR02284 family)